MQRGSTAVLAASTRVAGAEAVLRGAAAVGSVVIGVLLAWEIGVQAVL